MFRNGVECITGVIVVQDVVQLSEQQSQKDFLGLRSDMPDGAEITAHTAEVLRLVSKSALPDVGGWVGGDSWFGSVITAVEVKKRFGVHSTWIVKQNQHCFPMKPLFAILKARFKTRPAGHWVTMKTEIAGVRLIAIAYAWSQRGVSYILSTCGSTEPSDKLYTSYFEDEFGNVGSKQILRPKIAHLLYEYLPLVDEHNKQRQKILALEKKWPTRDCWFRLLTTLIGVCIVDLHRLFRNLNHDHFKEVDILQFSDLLCKKLKDRPTRQNAKLSSSEGEVLE